jgi:hypothetical protein
MAIKKKVYGAGHISNLSYDESTSWRDYAKKKFESVGIDFFSPMRMKQYLKEEKDLKFSYEKYPLSSSKGVMTRDRNDVITSNALLVNLKGYPDKMSIGTSMEIAWADLLRIPTVMVAEKNNVHALHPMTKEACGFIVEDLDEGIDLVISVLVP